MSMLAEPRRKQKVINLRAKNNAWSNDSTKFGQRMLEKMGWSSGKGLGANENGIVEHVVARYKNDEKGLGFEDRNDQWTKHEDDFNSLLANLSNAESPEVVETLHSGISLEKKSKKSKTRIHYHKFTRGKDLSRYSEKDLANIFGKKSFKEPEIKECIKEDTLKTTEQVFTEKGNMDDYFKNKLAAFKSKSKILNTDLNLKENDESDYAFQGFSNSSEPESDQNGCGFQPFSFYNSQKEDVTQNVELSCEDVETKSKKKKKSKGKEILSKAVEEENNFREFTQETTQEVLIEGESNKVKKSKKKKHIECVEEKLDKKEENNPSKCLKHANQISINIESPKAKKLKKKNYKVSIEESQSSDKLENRKSSSECAQEAIQDVRSSKKKSKRKKHQEYFEDKVEHCEEISKITKKITENYVEDIQDHLSMEDCAPKKKKKSKN